MLYSEQDLENLAYPLSDSDIEQGAEAFRRMVSVFMTMGYKIVCGPLNHEVNAAAFSAKLEAGAVKTELWLWGGYAKNTLAKKDREAAFLVITNGESIRILTDLQLKLKEQGELLKILPDGSMLGEGVRILVFASDDAGDASLETKVPDPGKRLKELEQKNRATSYAYKKIVRILKGMRYDLAQSGDVAAQAVSGFLLEDLLEQLPDEEYARYDDLLSKCSFILLLLHNKLERGGIESGNSDAVKKFIIKCLEVMERKDAYHNFTG